MKRFDALITTQKNLSSLQSPISDKIKKNRKKFAFLKKWYFIAVFLIFFRKETLQRGEVFLRCNQCITALHLRYRTTLLDDFHFLPYNGVRFFRPLVGGSIGVFGEKENCRVVCYDKRYLKPPGPEQIWISPPPPLTQCCSWHLNRLEWHLLSGVAADNKGVNINHFMSRIESGLGIYIFSNYLLPSIGWYSSSVHLYPI